jgi:hypothetical protein
VRWRSLSAEDGDVDEGEFTFRVDPEAPAAPPPPASPLPTAGSTPTQTPAATAESQASTGIQCFGSTLLGLGVRAIFWRRRRA